MAQVILQKPSEVNALHLGLDRLGGTPGDYIVEVGGENPNYLMVRTALEGVAQESLATFVNGHNSLTMTASKNTITADDVDTATLIMNAVSEVTYRVFGSGMLLDFDGTLTPNSGVVTYAFKTPVADQYLIEFQVGTATGYQRVEAING
jgi:hypothetical protein